MNERRARAVVVLLLAAHAVLFLLLFQRQFDDEQSRRIRADQADPSLYAHVESVLRHEGPLGLVTALWNGNREVELHRRYARLFLGRERDADGRVLRPYRDVAIEYPPLALAVVAVPALIADDPVGYRFWLAAWFAVIVVLNLGLALWIAVGRAPHAAALARGLAYSLAFLALFGDLSASRFDHVVPSFLLAGAWALWRAERAFGRAALAWCAAAGALAVLGAFAKFLPLLLLPAALRHIQVGQAANKVARAGAVVGGGLAMLLVLLTAFTVWLGPNASKGVLAYHGARGIEIESTWAGLLGLLHLAGLPLSVAPSFGAHHLVTPLTPWLKATALLAFVFLATLVLSRRRSEANQRIALQTSIAALLLAFLLTASVLSPQFLLWLLPFAATLFAVAPRFGRATWLLLLIALLTQLVYPQTIEALLRLEPFALALLCLRNALLGVLLIEWMRAAAAEAGRRPG